MSNGSAVRNAIYYEGIWLAPTSLAYTLLTNPPVGRNVLTIVQHMKDIDEKELKLSGRVSRGRWNIGQGQID